MAKTPKKASGSRVSNIMGLVRGNFDFRKSITDTPETTPVGGEELISKIDKTRLLADVAREGSVTGSRALAVSEMIGVTQDAYRRIGSNRIEYNRILTLMPKVKKAARLMIASTISPTDLTQDGIAIGFDLPDGLKELAPDLETFATKFFEDHLSLSTALFEWSYEAAYEAGAAINAVVPLRSFEKMAESAGIGTESFDEKIFDQIGQESLFGFGDSKGNYTTMQDVEGLESFASRKMKEIIGKPNENIAGTTEAMKKLVKTFVAQESLNLTDNPEILNVSNITKKNNEKITRKAVANKFGRMQQLIAIPESKDDSSLGEPIMIKLPPESVTVIHTPGNPNDHQAYLVMLDRFGNPVDATNTEETFRDSNNISRFSQTQNSVVNSAYAAYGLANDRKYVQTEVMGRVYTHVVEQHIRKRLNKAGLMNVSLAGGEAMFQYMFSRFLQNRQTRVLFLPKELVGYISFEKDRNGYGVSRLEGIKFSLGMKMAVQISRTLAALKAAMDKRNITIKFDPAMEESPESVMKTAVTEYLRKSVITFSTDPNVLQNQIAEKALSVKAEGIPGFENFDLTNEPDNRTGSLDFDSNVSADLDDDITNGLRVPASVMNALGEDEYSRSIATTNMFFAMDIAADQAILKRDGSDTIRKYALYSSSFIEGIGKIIPALVQKKKSSDKNAEAEGGVVEEQQQDKSIIIPKDFTFEDLVNCLSIKLPKPSVAPSKAQYEALTSMVEAVNTIVDNLFPDDLTGGNDTLRPALAALKAVVKSRNIKEYISRSGMVGVDVPQEDFTSDMRDLSNLTSKLLNLSEMLKGKSEESNSEASPGADASMPTF